MSCSNSFSSKFKTNERKSITNQYHKLKQGRDDGCPVFDDNPNDMPKWLKTEAGESFLQKWKEWYQEKIRYGDDGGDILHGSGFKDQLR